MMAFEWCVHLSKVNTRLTADSQMTFEYKRFVLSSLNAVLLSLTYTITTNCEERKEEATMRTDRLRYHTQCARKRSTHNNQTKQKTIKRRENGIQIKLIIFSMLTQTHSAHMMMRTRLRLAHRHRFNMA